MKKHLLKFLIASIAIAITFSSCDFFKKDKKDKKDPIPLLSTLPQSARTTNTFVKYLMLENNNGSFYDTNTLTDLYVKIPVNDGLFQIYDAYHVYSNGSDKGILLVISNLTTDEICGPVDSKLQELPLQIPISKIKQSPFQSDRFSLAKGDTIKVVVLNDHPYDFEVYKDSILKKLHKELQDSNYPFDCSVIKKDSITNSWPKRPEESGGGVIIGRP